MAEFNSMFQAGRRFPVQSHWFLQKQRSSVDVDIADVRFLGFATAEILQGLPETIVQVSKLWGDVAEHKRVVIRLLTPLVIGRRRECTPPHLHRRHLKCLRRHRISLSFCAMMDRSVSRRVSSELNLRNPTARHMMLPSPRPNPRMHLDPFRCRRLTRGDDPSEAEEEN
ncbi:hypothetical protein DNTS_030057, partial [Danionella cerebrum]